MTRGMATVGLAIAGVFVFLAAFFAYWNASYNRWMPHHDRIFRIHGTLLLPGMEPQSFPYAPGPLKDALEAQLEGRRLKGVVRIFAQEVQLRTPERTLDARVHYADESFFTVFDWPLAAGDAERFASNPSAVFVTERMAHKLFGGAPAIGRRITVTDGSRRRELVVAGVMRDWPENTTEDLRIDLLARIRESDFQNEPWVFRYWLGLNDTVFIRLRQPEPAAALDATLERVLARHLPERFSGRLALRATPLGRIHFWGLTAKSRAENARRLALVTGLAALVFIVAMANFSLIHAERALERERAFAVRLLLGAGRVRIASAVVATIATDAACAMALAALLVKASGAVVPELAQLLPVDREVLLRAVLTALLAAVTAVVAATSVSVARIARLPLAKTLRGVRGPTGLARRPLRTVLAASQFFAAVATVALALVAARQLGFAGTVDRGFSADGVFIIDHLDWPAAMSRAELLRRRVAELPGVASATLSGTAPPDVGGDLVTVRLDDRDVREVNVRQATIDPHYLETYDIRLIAGRNLDENRPGDREPDAHETIRDFSILINRTAARLLGFSQPESAVGRIFVIRPGTDREARVHVAGVVDDVLLEGVYRPIEPTIYSWQRSSIGVLSVRYTGPDRTSFRTAVEAIWRELVPEVPFRMESVAQRIVALDAESQLRGRALAFFAGVTLFLAAMGIFALAYHQLEEERVIFALHRLLGASAMALAGLFASRLGRPFLAAALLALPLAWVLAERWLEGFAYRIALTPLPFIEALGLVLAVAAITVSGHMIRLLTTRPVMVLRAG
ncbi:MAG: ABC transporter permease [Rhodothalassiaceae bacterium]|nr:MAG: ABC transporter permease [Rhodothalassiaceae bacterium]